MRKPSPILLLVAAAGWWAIPRAFPDKTAPVQETLRLRRPVALLLVDQDKRLLVANRDSGTIVILDTETGKALGETKVGRRLADIAGTPDRGRIVVTDEEAGELVVLARERDDIRVERRVPVGVSPVSVQLSADGKLATVACLWLLRLAIVDLASGKKADIDLPFAPRRQLLLPGGDRVIVADSFGGKLAVVNVHAKKIESVRELPVHNIRGLALGRDAQNLLIAHQTLYALGRPTRGDIQSANLLANRVTVLNLADVLRPGADVWRNGRSHEFGDIERGAGDPAGVAEGANGEIILALAGTNELASAVPERVIRQRVNVGLRPTALVLDAARRRAYVANTFGDSISIVDLRDVKAVREVGLGAQPQLGPEERGELLFYDARLSNDAWFSCHSCHTDGHTNGLLNDNFTDGSFGTPKRVLSLLGAKDTGPWAWNGHMAKLEDQVQSSIRSTMQGAPPGEKQARDLTAYLRTLTPPPSLLKARGTLDAEAFARGRKVFAEHKCATCHAGPSYTTPKTYDVGLRDEAGQTHFNPPSLRGLSQAGPYFHDNRAGTLHEVFTRHRHGATGELAKDELADLLHFLNGL